MMNLDLCMAEAHTADPTEEWGSVTEAKTIEARVNAIDWAKVHTDLDAQGWAIAPGLITDEEADSISGLYHQEQGFRSHIITIRHGFGRGEYKYFSYLVGVDL